MNQRSEEGELKARTRRSFLIFGCFLVFGGSFWKLLFSQSTDQGIPWPLRKVLRINESIASYFFNLNRITKASTHTHGQTPRVNGDIGIEELDDSEAWRLEIIHPLFDDQVLKRFSIKELQSYKKVQESAEFRCIEGWSMSLSYAGIRFSDFINSLTKTESFLNLEAYQYVGLETPNQEYYVSIDMRSMLHSQTLLAYEMNGQSLSEENGAPLRLIIPVKYGIKHLKQVSRIRFSNSRLPDYWAERGYDWYAGL